MLYRFEIINEYLKFDSKIEKIIYKKMKLTNKIIVNWVFLNNENVEILYYYDNSKRYYLNADKIKSLNSNITEIEKFENYSITVYKKKIEIYGDADQNKITNYVSVKIKKSNENSLTDNIFLLFMVKNDDYEYLIEEIKINIDFILTMANNIRQALVSYERMYNTVDELVKILMEKDIYMPNHMTNVAQYCLKMSLRLNLNKLETNIIYLSSLLHDIGKLYINDNIINCKEKLSEEEFNVIKTHAIRGNSIAKSIFMDIDIFKEVPDIILSHHENYDGTGYPLKIKGNEIPLFSRIIRICDSVDAMLSRRVYKTPLGFSEVIEQLKKYRGKHYDPDLTNIMISILKESPVSDIDIKDIEGTILPNISLNLMYKNSNLFNQITLTGNMIIYNKKNIEFIFENSKTPITQKDLDFDECKLFFIISNNCYECDVDVKAVSDNKIYLENLSFNIIDSYFSLPWFGEAIVSFNENTFVKLEILLLGVSKVILKIDNETFSKVKKDIDSKGVIYLNESVGKYEIKETISISFERTYKISEGIILIVEYSDILDNQKDKLLNLLLKKQIGLNMKRYSTEI